MKEIYRKLQFLSNIATVVIAILLCAITVKLFFFSTPQDTGVLHKSNTITTSVPSQILPVGRMMPLENINWKENKKTLVLYISTNCHFCDESSPFYKRLVEKYADDKNVKLIAVLPQTVDEAKGHLKGLGVNINDVYNAKLISIGVTATPTLLLVNESGIISDMWKGKLTDDKETEVINKLSS